MAAVYPRLLRRVRAALVDSVILVILFVTCVLLLHLLGNVHPTVKLVALVLGLLAFEPGLVSWTGGTIGHHMLGLRVRDSREDRNIGFLRATLRAVVRTLLGWLSLAFILATRRHQAIHDYVFHTVVALRSPDNLPEKEKLAERVLAPEGFELSSRLRRASVIVLYGGLSYVGLAVLATLLLSKPCRYLHACDHTDDILSASLSIVWLVVLIAVIVLGWRGRLFGCRNAQAREGSR